MSEYHQSLKDALRERLETSFPDHHSFSSRWFQRFFIKHMLINYNLRWRQKGNIFSVSIRNKEQAYAWIEFLIWADHLMFKIKFRS